MNKYLTAVICSFLVVGLIPQVVNAGDQNNPEISDPENDVLLFGQFSPPKLNRFLKHIDILSAWFSEDSDEPDLMYITLQLQDVKKIRLMGLLAVDWYHDGLEYSVIILFKHGEENASGLQIGGTNFMPMTDLYTIDDEKNTITWVVPKEVIGNVTQGDTLNTPVAVVGVRFCSDVLANLMMNRFGTNCIGIDFTDVGKDYEILY
jgi:hypothetical protein